MKREIKGIRAKGCVEKWFSPLWWFPSWPFRNNRRFQTVPRGTEMDLLLEAWKGEGFGFERKERRDGFDRKLYKAVSRAILYFIFERHADWTRTLTALVVMLYNALSLVRLSRWITPGKRGPQPATRPIFRDIKYDDDVARDGYNFPPIQCCRELISDNYNSWIRSFRPGFWETVATKMSMLNFCPLPPLSKYCYR